MLLIILSNTPAQPQNTNENEVPLLQRPGCTHTPCLQPNAHAAKCMPGCSVVMRWLQALIRDMKAKLAELSETPANLQRLVFRGHMLKDEQSLSHHSELSVHHAQSQFLPAK